MRQPTRIGGGLGLGSVGPSVGFGSNFNSAYGSAAASKMPQAPPISYEKFH